MNIIKIRLSTTNGDELYPEDFILTVENEGVTPQMVDEFINTFKAENEDYQTDDVINDLEKHFGGSITNATFIPDVDIVI